ncbi:MAG: hypothetical protein D6718_05265 [Acidobacteria bacterium]|nr:MAG: hypothetical protein D6718_05265 [Acidobacteriota bacterium]
MRVGEEVSAGKVKIGAEEALELARSVSKILVARGKKLVEFDMRRSPPPDDELLGLILGRSGTLRAPAIRTGKTLLVGFNEEAYRRVFG